MERLEPPPPRIPPLRASPTAELAEAPAVPRRARGVPLRRLLLPPVLVPTALVLIHAADASGAGAGATGALLIGREDLLRVRASLGRISDELHLILGIIDQHLEASTAASAAAHGMGMGGSSPSGVHMGRSLGSEVQPVDFVPVPREAGRSNASSSGAVNGKAPVSRPFVSAGLAWFWTLGEWMFWFSIFVLDIGIVVGMQLFLESIGRKRGGSTIMPKKNVANAIAVKAAGPPGAPIPTPSGTPARESTQRLSVLSQEELLAACLAEHWGKLAVGVGLAVAGRLPQRILNNESLVCHMLINLAVMLRCMSLVMLLIRDDVALPKRDKVVAPPAPLMPPMPTSPRRRPSGLGDGG